MWGLKTRGKLDNYIHEIDSSNTVNGKPIYYFKNQEGLTIPSDAGQVYLVNCIYCKVANLNITNASYTIHICYSHYNTIENNYLDNSVIGIMFDHSFYNIIRNNTIRDIYCGGVFFDFSDYNIIEHNNVTNRYGGLAFEMGSDYNVIRYNNLKPDGASIFFDDSDYNKVYYNNIYGSFIGFNGRKAALMWGESRHTVWKDNYWNNWPGLKYRIFKKFPRAILGMHLSMYESFLANPSKITIPSYIRFDWSPVEKPYAIPIPEV